MVTVEAKAETSENPSAQLVEETRRNLLSGLARVAGQVPVDGAGQMVDRGRLAQVGVHDDVEFFELFENSVNGRQTDVGQAALNGEGNFVHGEVVGRPGQYVGESSFRGRYAPRVATDRGDDLVLVESFPGHPQTIGRSPSVERVAD